MDTAVDISTLESRIKWAESAADYRMLHRISDWEVSDETIEWQIELCHHFAEGVGSLAWQIGDRPAGGTPILEYRRPNGATGCLQFPQQPLDIGVKGSDKVPIIYASGGRELVLTGKIDVAQPVGPTMEDYLELIEDSGQPILSQLSAIRFQPIQVQQPAQAIQPAAHSSPQPLPAFEPAIVAI